MSKVALTQGQWSVIDKNIWLDEINGFVYFHGLRETPLEKHLYVVSIDQPCNVRRLTTSGYSHTANLNQVSLNLLSFQVIPPVGVKSVDISFFLIQLYSISGMYSYGNEFQQHP